MTDDPEQDDHRFDRLIDGELDAHEYQRLIDSLDLQPDGWRNCALAFLEAQALGDELRSLRSESCRAPERDQVSAARTSIARQTKRSGPDFIALFFAAAVSFVIALGLGMILRTHWIWPTPLAPTQGVQLRSTADPTRQLPADAGKEGNVMLVENEWIPPRPPGTSFQPRGHVRMAVDGPNEALDQPVEIPFFDLDQFDPNWLVDNDPRQIAEMIRILQRMGREVRRDHHLVPVRSRDGLHVVIPVEEFEIMPASVGLFQ